MIILLKNFVYDLFLTLDTCGENYFSELRIRIRFCKTGGVRIQYFLIAGLFF